MKRLFVSLVYLLFLAFVSSLNAGMTMMIAGGGCSTSIADDFSGDESNWTEVDGAPVVQSGIYDFGDGTGLKGVSLYTNEETCSLNQWVLFEIDAVESVDYVYSGAYLRGEVANTNYQYAVRVDSAAVDEIEWRYCAGGSTHSTCTTIVAATMDTAFAAGQWFGAAVTGTGNDTIMYVWEHGTSDPGAWDGTIGAGSNWGSPNHTFTDNPANPADTGTYIGLYTGHATYWTEFDNFEGGHWTP